MTAEVEQPGALGLSIAAALTLLIVGQAAGGAAVYVFGPPAGAEASLLPPWVFALVWTILYPSLGRASVKIWLQRDHPAAGATLTLGLVAIAISVAWMPVVCAAKSPWVPVFMDGLGLMALWATALAYRRISPRAAAWVLPAVVWMPITTLISLQAAL